MTKLDIVNSISEQTGIDKEEVYAVVEAFTATVKDSLLNDNYASTALSRYVKNVQDATSSRTQPSSSLNTNQLCSSLQLHSLTL